MEVDFAALRRATESGLALARDRDGAPSPRVLSEIVERKSAAHWFHGEVVGRFSAMTARALQLQEDEVRRIELAGRFHDIGKVLIPDHVIDKPGPLSGAEWAQVRRHPEIGARLLAAVGLDEIAPLVLTHHERPDGAGYAYGLSGEEIPLGARVLAVTDAYDAMTTTRPYRDTLTHEEARHELWRAADTQFDRCVVAAFLGALG